ncbi:MAG: C40 family peptidase [Muribaculaceae bacterium]|nr:C40 family peptidase [Muribaculaceae bacterium]MDE6130520.1 C40 family peptidase [Muribaculaceae bacterium]
MKYRLFTALTVMSAVCMTAPAAGNGISDSGDFALVRISVANMRSKPGHSQELASQAVMGTPVKLLSKEGDWYKVESPDGYTGWIIDNSLQPLSPEQFDNWRKTPRLVMTSHYQIRLYTDSLTDCPRNTVTDLVNGCIVQLSSAYTPSGETCCKKKSRGRVKVTLPDGRDGWGDMAAFTAATEWADQQFDAEKILTLAYSMIGQPYLWGGTSTKSLDCSGLSKVCYLNNGIILMRDASQQARTGSRIEASDWRSCQAGDLLFFGNATTGKVTHVAIYDHNGNYVHSSGRVKRNSVDPDSETYLSTPFLHAVRIHGNEGSEGITRVIDHPWYFLTSTN